jgi:SAM-dependent methyltransferase
MRRRSAGNQQKHESSNPLQRKLLDRFYDEAERLLRSVDPGSILDLGCGEGFMLRELVDRGLTAELTGIDRSAAAIASARERLGDGSTFVEGDVRHLDAELGSFDVVMMLEVLEHLDEPDDALALLEGLGSAHILLSVPWEPYFRGLNLMRLKNVRRFGNDPEHVQHWSKRGFDSFVSGRFELVGRGSTFPWTLLLVRPRVISSS